MIGAPVLPIVIRGQVQSECPTCAMPIGAFHRFPPRNVLRVGLCWRAVEWFKFTHGIDLGHVTGPPGLAMVRPLEHWQALHKARAIVHAPAPPILGDDGIPLAPAKRKGPPTGKLLAPLPHEPADDLF
jgi:hypothetical protein